MRRVIAYVVLNLKSLLKDKLPFVWSVFFPLILFFLEKDNIIEEKDLVSWWAYMILCAYFYGVGLYAVELREMGALRTIFSIYNSSIVFFIGNLITQMLFCVISLNMFNLIVWAIKQFSMLYLLRYSAILIFLCIPFAFLGYALVLIQNIHVNTIRTILSIVLFSMFILLSTESVYNQYNPLYYLVCMLIGYNRWNVIMYVCCACLAFGVGGIGIMKFNPNSNERR